VQRMARYACAALLFAHANLLLAMGEEASNPISRVVELLWEIKKNVEFEGEKEQKLFDKYECFCKTGKANLEQNVADESMKTPQVQGDLGEAKSYLTRLAEEIRGAQQERKAVQKKMGQAEAMRRKDALAFSKSSSELNADIQALGKAIQALERGSGDAFLQTDEAGVLRDLVDSDKVAEDSREALMSLLGISEDSEETVAGPSSEVIGICKQLKASFEESLAKATKQEEEDTKDYEMIQSSSTKEAKALASAIKTKSERAAEIKAKIVDIADDVESTSESLSRDQMFVQQMKTTCGTLEATYAEHKRMRGEELVTLSETIKILGNDDTTDLFASRKVSSSPASFLQVRSRAQGGSRNAKLEAIRLLKAANASGKSAPVELNLLVLALRGKHANFGKLIKMIDGMIGVLKKEDKADEKKKRSCMKESDETDDSLKEAREDIKSMSKVIADQKETLTTLKAEVSNLADGIKRIDEAMEESTADRKANHDDFLQVLAKNRRAIKVIEDARKRLLKFYNPDVAEYDKPDDVDVKTEETNPNLFGPGAMGMMKGMTGFNQEASGLQEDAESQEAAEAQDEADAGPQAGRLEKYVKENKASANALELLLQVKSEILRDTTEAQQEEKNHKASYQMMLANANGKRSRMVKTMMQKQSVTAKLEEDIHKLRGKRKQSEEMHKALSNFNVQLQQECGWLLDKFVPRHRERMRQISGLVQARTILAGATGTATS